MVLRIREHLQVRAHYKRRKFEPKPAPHPLERGIVHAPGGKAWRHGGMAAKMPPGGKDNFGRGVEGDEEHREERPEGVRLLLRPEVQ